MVLALAGASAACMFLHSRCSHMYLLRTVPFPFGFGSANNEVRQARPWPLYHPRPTGGFPTATATTVYPTGTGTAPPFPTGTGDYNILPFPMPIEKRGLEIDYHLAPRQDGEGPRTRPHKGKGKGHGTGYPTGTGFPFPTGTGFPFPTGTGKARPTPTTNPSDLPGFVIGD